ncbi:MAG: hypothetical protein ACRC1H_03695, partial [Caldilineaceae bacterium]
GAALPIVGKPTPDTSAAAGAGWWQVEYAGQVGWVSGEFGRAVGPLESVPLVALAETTAPDAGVNATAAEIALASAAGPDAALVTLSLPAGADAAARTLPFSASPPPAGGWLFGGPQPRLSPRP